jgi:AbrB family looped-hinge helix DNA binding protein
MPLVTIKPKFQVTLPVKLREQIALREGDVLDAVLVQEGILLRPQVVMDKRVAASQLKALFAQAPADLRDESIILQEAIGDIAAYRAGKSG